MKEQLEPQTDPILEECYRMKAEFAAQFNSIEELYDYLKAVEKKRRAQGKIYRSASTSHGTAQVGLKGVVMTRRYIQRKC